VNEKAGARTLLALVFASIAIGAVLLFLTDQMRNLPEPVLAAVILIAVGGLIRPRELLHLKKVSKLEFRVAMLATVGVLSFGILKGILLAAIFSILMLLRGAAHPRIVLLGRLSGTDRFVDSERYPGSEMTPNILVLRVESGLFYFNAQSVKTEILRRMRQRAKVRLVVIDLSTSPNIDLAGVRMLGELQQQLSQDGVPLRLAEVHGDVRDLCQAEGLHLEIQGISQRLSIAALVDKSWEEYKSA
jgi:MFS superfamily sulfate permease-like transporter